jgi:hypothetical protein
MLKRGLRRGAVAFWSVIAAVALFVVAAPPAAQADTMRTLKVALSCVGGIPYGLLASTNGSAWYYPDGSSYLSGGTKYFTVFIPASTSTVALDTYCDDGTPGGTRQGYTYSVTAGTSTINATASCVNQQVDPGPWVRYCYMGSISYS